MPPRGTDWTDVIQLDYENQEMRAAMIDALEYWVRDFNIDGYRCDVAGMVPTDFWKEVEKEAEELEEEAEELEEETEVTNAHDRLPIRSTCFRSRVSWVRVPPAQFESRAVSRET